MADRKTLGQYLEQVRFDDAALSPELLTLVLDLAAACKTISRRLADAPLRTAPYAERRAAAPATGDLLSGGDGRRAWIARLRSGAGESWRPNACHLHRGRHQVVLLPVDSPSNVEVNATGGTIFSVSRLDVGQARPAQICSGYAIHGPSLVLVLALGKSVQAFALDRQRDEFVLTHADMRIPAATDSIAIDASQTRFWTPPIRRYVDECLAGATGPRGKDFQVQWLGSMVAEAHRILTHGGVFVCPGHGKAADQLRQPWLQQEVNPISFVIERAGGRASTGTTRILDVGLSGPPARPSLIFGSAEEVERLEAYHGSHDAGAYDAPLFSQRGLFRSPV